MDTKKGKAEKGDAEATLGLMEGYYAYEDIEFERCRPHRENPAVVSRV